MADWKDAIRAVAPGLATALGTLGGGPLLGAALGQLSTVLLGKPDGTEGEIADALNRGLSGDQIVALKQAEQSFQIEMARIAQAEDASVLEDRKDARARQIASKDLMPHYIFWTMAVLYATSTALLYYGPTPTDDFTRTLLVKAYTVIEVGFTSALFYFVGSSNGSRKSGDAVRAIAEKQS